MQTAAYTPPPTKPCPRCGAAPGSPCFDRGGKLKPRAHAARLRRKTPRESPVSRSTWENRYFLVPDGRGLCKSCRVPIAGGPAVLRKEPYDVVCRDCADHHAIPYRPSRAWVAREAKG